MQLSNEIFVLRAPVDSLAVGPSIAFSQGDLHALQNGDEVRARLRLARLDPVAMPRLRRAFERWRLSQAIDLDDDALIEQVATDVRTSRLMGILLRNPDADFRPGAEIASIKQELGAARPDGGNLGGLPLEARLDAILKRAAETGQVVDTRAPWHRLTSEANLARNVSVLRAWTRTHSRGPATLAEAFHEAKGAHVPSLTLFDAAARLYAVLGTIGAMRTDRHLDEAASGLLRVVRMLEVNGFLDIVYLASNRGTEGITPTAPSRKKDQRPEEPVQRRVASADAPARKPAPPKATSTKEADASEGIANAAAQAGALKQAHKDGTPFCEKCS